MDKENNQQLNTDEILEELSIIKNRLKQFRNSGYWPDAYVVDDIAIYGAKGRVLLCVDENVEEFDVPEGVVNIYHRCFAGCEKLQQVSIPSSVKRIGKRAFYGCVSLKEIVIPESVYMVEEEMFMHCTSLEHVVLSSHITEIPHGMFCNCRSLHYWKLPEHIKIINVGAFRRCYSLERIELNEQLEVIRESAFEDCYSMKELIMPESVKSIRPGLFNGCHSLEHIHLSSQIKDFGGSGCCDCWNINKITMQEDEYMKSYAREHWEEYSDIVDMSKSENPIPESKFWTMGDTLYFGIPRLTSVCLVLCFSKEKEFTIPSFVTNIKSSAFITCRNLRTLRLSPFIKASDDPWERNCITYSFIYDNWPQVENIIFDETLKHTKYAFGLLG